MRLPSASSHDFSRVPKATIPRSKFDRSFTYKTAFESGYLIPVFLDEALPGDTFNVDMTAFARLATPKFPIMDNMRLQSFFFAVPYRLIWNNFQKMCGEQVDPDDTTDYIFPVMDNPTGGKYLTGTLGDYFGLPVDVTIASADRPMSLPFRAYNLIWNEWFRDQNLQDSAVVDKDDGPDSAADYPLLRVNKVHDYFTSCLPFPQKGEAVSLFSAADLPIIPDGQMKFNNPTGSNPDYIYALKGGTEVSNPVNINSTVTPGALGVAQTLNYYSGLAVDTSESGATTINGLRQAFALQKALERDARGGSRYTEIIRSHFGVVSPDARLQRPEYLGGGSTPVIIHQVAQTSSTDATTPQGNLSAFGTVVASRHGFVKSFVEHSIVMGFVVIRSDLSYQQGMERMWSRSTRWDMYWPAFAHIGEQAVLNKEIYLSGVTGTDNTVFGYQERHAEYRYKPSKITGLLRSNVSGSLDAWHVAQDFEATPVLDDTFIQENAPVDRVIAVPSAPHFIFDSYFKMVCARPMPMYSVPGYIDHF